MHLSRQGSRFQSYELLNIILKTKYKTSRTKVMELPTTKVRVQFTIWETFLSHLSSVSMSLAPWRSLTHRDTWEMGSLDVESFVVSIAGWSTWGAFGGITLMECLQKLSFSEWIFSPWWIHDLKNLRLDVCKSTNFQNMFLFQTSIYIYRWKINMVSRVRGVARTFLLILS